jgi:hypothetical protein
VNRFRRSGAVSGNASSRVNSSRAPDDDPALIDCLPAPLFKNPQPEIHRFDLARRKTASR